MRITKFKKGDRVRHVRTDRQYLILEAPRPDHLLERAAESFYIYQGADGGPHWYRGQEEMEDGRFALVPAASKLWQAYCQGFTTAQNRYLRKHSGPSCEVEATPELTDEIAKLVDERLLDFAAAKKLARRLGAMEYGELGLSWHRLMPPLKEALGSEYEWRILRRFFNKCPHGN